MMTRRWYLLFVVASVPQQYASTPAPTPVSPSTTQAPVGAPTYYTKREDDDEYDKSIVGGVPVEAGDFPYFALPTYGNGLCGGTKIHDDFVLTAAHCGGVFRFGDVVIGLTTRWNGERVGVDYELPHPDYDGDVLNDIMLVKLSSVAASPSVVLNRDRSIPQENDVSVAIGFGATTEGGFGSNVLLKVDLPVESDNACSIEYPFAYVEDVMVCAGGGTEGGRDTCQGDSGGPLLTTDGVLIGISSFGLGCARPGVPAAYTRVSAYTDWIFDEICARSINPPYEICPSLSPSQSVSPSHSPTVSLAPSPGPSELQTTLLENGVPVGPLILGQRQSLFFEYLSEFNYTVVCTLRGDTGDADLYLEWGEAPRGYVDCASSGHTSDEFCEVDNPRDGTPLFVRVNAYFAFYDVILTCTETDPDTIPSMSPTGSVPPSASPTELAVIDLVNNEPTDPLSLARSQGQYYRYSPESVTSAFVRCALLGSAYGDADLFVEWGSIPAYFDSDCYSTSGGSNEICIVNIPGDGSDLFVLVYAFSPFADVSLICTEPITQSLQNGVSTDRLSLVAGQQLYYDYTPSGAVGGSVTCTLSGNNGNADLRLKWGDVPRLLFYGDCVSTGFDSNEICEVAVPSVTSILYVVVDSIESFDGVVLTCGEGSTGGACPFNACTASFGRSGFNIYRNGGMLGCRDACTTSDFLLNFRFSRGWQCGVCPEI